MSLKITRLRQDDTATSASGPLDGAVQLPAVSPQIAASDATAIAGNDNGPLAEDRKAKDPQFGGLVDSETGEPLSAATGLGEIDESAWPGIVDREPPEGAGLPRNELELTEDYIARAFVDRYVWELRYDHDKGSWYIWDGSHWREDETKGAFDKVRAFCRAVRGEARAMSSRRAVEGVEVMASRDPQVAMTTRDWNPDPWLLGTPAGYVNLKCGELFEPDPALNVSQLTSVGPAERGTPIPHFATFLDEVTQGDAGLQRFLQQYIGYCLTGDTREQVLLFVYGPGGNGKSALQTVITEIMGNYAKTAVMETFSARHQPRHLTEIAMLLGARLVTLSETEKGQRWSQARLNQMTGGDNITANFMYHDMFTFRPVFKTFVVGNHKPHLASVNDAERRRFLIVPFLHKPANPDRRLAEKLRDEYSGILRWAIEGCLDWQENGLLTPQVVKEATDDYFATEDFFGRWVDECCERGPGLKAKATPLWQSFSSFAEDNGEDAGSMKSFSNCLANAGIEKMKSGGSSVYLGIALKSVATLQISSGDLGSCRTREDGERASSSR